MIRALSQRRLTKEDKAKFQRIYEEANHNFNENVGNTETAKKHELFKEKLYQSMKSINKFESTDNLRIPRAESQPKINALNEFEDIQKHAKM